MSQLQFEALREKLLVAGVAPRHVRRYVGELRQHFDDLLRAEAGNGLSGEAAKRAARVRLGSDTSLANAMLARPELRSVTARFPWLVFGILPPLAVIVGFAAVVIVTQLVAIRGGAYIPRQGFVAPAPAWMVWILQGTMFALNFLVVPLLGALLAWVAQRQRMKLLWPILGMVLLLMLHVHGIFRMDAQGRIGRGFGTIIPLPGLFWSVRFYGPVFLAQAALLCLPLAWLWRARQKALAAQ
jgi:hypothetical protein